MVKIAATLVALVVATVSANATTIELAGWVAGWPHQYAVSGVKTEPTYREVVEIRREGDVFTVRGGAPAWMELATEAIAVDEQGGLRYVVCPKGMHCNKPGVPAGFLASAALLSAYRRGQLMGTGEVLPFGDHEVVCVSAERVGIAEPILDPCLDGETGAVLAQRHRRTGRFDGPSLDPDSIAINVLPRPSRSLRLLPPTEPAS